MQILQSNGSLFRVEQNFRFHSFSNNFLQKLNIFAVERKVSHFLQIVLNFYVFISLQASFVEIFFPRILKV